jgi:hypothetical protein
MLKNCHIILFHETIPLNKYGFILFYGTEISAIFSGSRIGDSKISAGC